MVDNEVALRDAQEAAETYWEAWQDAAVWWKEKVERLESQLDSSRVANGLRQRRLDVAVAERDRLREALREYGAHHQDCPLSDSIARLRGAVPCSCGLSDLVA
jgi:hypothetical protein